MKRDVEKGKHFGFIISIFTTGKRAFLSRIRVYQTCLK